MVSDAAVTLEIFTYQPWPAGEALKLGDVVFADDSKPSTMPMLHRLVARVVLPEADDKVLIDQARGTVRAKLSLLRLALPEYATSLGDIVSIQHRVGRLTARASATIVNSTPLPVSDLEAARAVAGTIACMKVSARRRSIAAAYWLQQSRVAPEAAQRIPAACFAIEAAINTSGAAKPKDYLEAITRRMGFSVGRVEAKLVSRLTRIVEMRASIVHDGDIDKPSKKPELEHWVRDLAEAVVRKKVGLAVPATLAILDGL